MFYLHHVCGYVHLTNTHCSRSASLNSEKVYFTPFFKLNKKNLMRNTQLSYQNVLYKLEVAPKTKLFAHYHFQCRYFNVHEYFSPEFLHLKTLPHTHVKKIDQIRKHIDQHTYFNTMLYVFKSGINYITVPRI